MAVNLPSADQLIEPIAVLNEGKIEQGQIVADFGCGTVGHFVFAAARLVGQDGKVYAIDIQKSVIAAIDSRMKQDAVNNVTPLWGDIERPKGVRVIDGAFDLSLVINNLFLSSNRDGLAEEVRRCTKVGGKLVVIDWVPTTTPIGPPVASRMSPEAAKTLLAAHGFAFDHAFTPGDVSWGLVFTRAS